MNTKAVISLLRDLIETLNLTIDELDEDEYPFVIELLDNRLMRTNMMLEHLTGELQQGNSPIEELLDEYEMTNSTLADVKASAARYSYTTSDSQIRCILHIVGHSPEIKDKEKDV